MTDDHDHLWQTLANLVDAGDVSSAIAFLLQSELKEDSRGQRYIGWLYSTRNEFVAAGAWYLKAARQGNEEALADCMECARLMWRDGFREDALALAESPPLSSLETFQRYLASRYLDLGDGEKLLEWASRLALSGKEGDVVYVARLLISQGNPMAAVPHLESAAERGSPAAHQLLGELYWQGIGVAQDKLKASLHYRESARHGYLLSQNRLLHSNRALRGAWYLPVFTAGLLTVLTKAIVLTYKNRRDPRLADLPECIPRQRR